MQIPRWRAPSFWLQGARPWGLGDPRSAPRPVSLSLQPHTRRLTHRAHARASREPSPGRSSHHSERASVELAVKWRAPPPIPAPAQLRLGPAFLPNFCWQRAAWGGGRDSGPTAAGRWLVLLEARRPAYPALAHALTPSPPLLEHVQALRLQLAACVWRKKAIGMPRSSPVRRPRARLVSIYPSPWRRLQCWCRPLPVLMERGSMCRRGMRAGGMHPLSVGAAIVAELRRRSTPAVVGWERGAVAAAAADVNRDSWLVASEMVALCMSVGPAWTEARVRDVFRNCL